MSGYAPIGLTRPTTTTPAKRITNVEQGILNYEIFLGVAGLSSFDILRFLVQYSTFYFHGNLLLT